VTDDFVEPLAGVRQFNRSATTLEQFHAEKLFQFLELAAVLALAI
jgi:hypothetical protein